VSGEQIAVRLPTDDVEPQKAWTRDRISPDRWLIPVPPACVAELDQVVATLRVSPRPLERLTPVDFSLRACSALMSRVRTKLQTETGLAVVDRFPVERYAAEDNRAIGWLLAAMLGQVVAQKATGARMYDVRDTGQALGYGVRRSVTNLGQPFHTDGGWLWKAPAFVGLFCLESALEGGLSRFASLVTAHNVLRRTRPDLLARLYRPFPWDRQGEHAPDAPRVSWQPVFEYGGTLSARYYGTTSSTAIGWPATRLTTRAGPPSPPSARSSTTRPAGSSSGSRRDSSSTSTTASSPTAAPRSRTPPCRGRAGAVTCSVSGIATRAPGISKVARPPDPARSLTLALAVHSGLVRLLAYRVRGMAGLGSGLIAVPPGPAFRRAASRSSSACSCWSRAWRCF
jgi:hypothetical protein